MLVYQIAQVDFQFLDDNKIKSRHCLVLTKPRGKYKIVVIAYMTSTDSLLENTDVSLEIDQKYFKKTGLNTNTIIKLHRLENISVDSLKGKLGELDKEKSQEVNQKLKLLFKLFQ